MSLNPYEAPAPLPGAPTPRNGALIILRLAATAMILTWGYRFLQKAAYWYYVSTSPWGEGSGQVGWHGPWAQVGIPLTGLLAGLLMLKPSKWLFVPLLAHWCGYVGLFLFLTWERWFTNRWFGGNILLVLLLEMGVIGLALLVVRRRAA
jgi:hypothetical protein